MPYGGPGLLRRKENPENRFLSKVLVRINGCWIWQGYIHEDGYGDFWFDNRTWKPHVWAWERLNGPVPEGLELDHTCKNRSCVNPLHVEPVTHRENLLRSPITPAAINLAKVFCLKGHLLSGDNLYVRPDGKQKRECRACQAVREHERAERRKLLSREGG